MHDLTSQRSLSIHEDEAGPDRIARQVIESCPYGGWYFKLSRFRVL